MALNATFVLHHCRYNSGQVSSKLEAIPACELFQHPQQGSATLILSGVKSYSSPHARV